MTAILTKEEQEEKLNRKMEEMKKKNAELIRRHKLIEEDKRLAEEQGRSVTLKNCQTLYTPMKGEIASLHLIATDSVEKGKSRQQNCKNKPVSKKYSEPKVKVPTENINSGPPPDPACKFLADRRREGPLPDQGRNKDFSRRHPRNFGGTEFKDVPKKIHDEKERLLHQPQTNTKVDFTVFTTGKERREMEEWRKEREKIDRERLERQKNKEGNWRREWDKDKDYLSEQLNQPEKPQTLRQAQTVSRPVGRIGSGRFAPGLHKLSGLHKSFTRKDDRIKVSGRGRSNQQKKVGHGDSNSEITQELEREKPKSVTSLPVQKSVPRADPKLSQGNVERRLRVVHEQNDSLVIKVKNQPTESQKSQSNKTVSFLEPYQYVDLQQTMPPQRNNKKNFSQRVGVNCGNFSDGSHFVSNADSKGFNRELLTTESSNSRNSSENNTSKAEKLLLDSIRFVKNSEFPPKKETRRYKGEKLVMESIQSSENVQLLPKKVQAEFKGEKLVGSGRISVQEGTRKRRNKNKKKRSLMFENQQKKCSSGSNTASSLAIIITKTNPRNTETNEKCDKGNGKEDRDAVPSRELALQSADACSSDFISAVIRERQEEMKGKKKKVPTATLR